KLECAQYRRVGRQQRLDFERARRLPSERLSICAARFAAPAEDTEEIKLDERMRIKVSPGEPWRGARDFDAELFAKLACERLARRFACFELASRELPIAGIRRSGKALREQHLAIAALQHGRRNANDRFRRHFFRARAFSARAPARERANCQATRPLREPR